ncbi:PadR family transcriptional regulator [Sphaerisporangium sp. NPDC004334]
MTVPLALLGLLDREPSYGYDLKRDYDAYFGRGKPLPSGQVYSTLGRLARDGKVTAGQSEPGDGPDRKRYAITPAGKQEVAAWLAEPVAAEPFLQTVLFTKVVPALMLGQDAEGFLDTSVPRTCGTCAACRRSNAAAPSWTPCWPTTPCSTWTPTCAGRFSRRGQRRSCRWPRRPPPACAPRRRCRE